MLFYLWRKEINRININVGNRKWEIKKEAKMAFKNNKNKLFFQINFSIKFTTAVFLSSNDI